MKTRLSPAAIGRWSARRPWLAIALWLAFVVACLAALAVTGSKQLERGATGESARAESMQRAHDTGPAESEYAYLHSRSLRAGDPTFRAAIAKVRASMESALGGGASGAGITTRISADSHSALVTAPV